MSIQASASTASTRPESGTLCSRFAFILDAGTVHVVASRSNSSHLGATQRTTSQLTESEWPG